MNISLILAMDRNRVIGAGGDLPWRLPDDMKYFKARTMGKPIIMGRKTYETIGKPLPGRQNIVITRQREYQAPGCTVVHSPQEALSAAGSAPEVMITGGAEIYRRFLPQADRIYLTLIDASLEGDTFFPELAPGEWQTIWEERHDADARNPYAYRFLVLERRGKPADKPAEG